MATVRFSHQDSLKDSLKDSTTHGSDSYRQRVSKLDRDPFYKSHVITVRTVIQVFAEISYSTLFPIIIAFGLSFLMYYLLYPSFVHVKMYKYHVSEGIISVCAIYLWNITSQILSKYQFYKTQFVLSRILCVLFLTYNTFFLYRWFVTPGTNVNAFMNHITLIFLLWNYFGFGIAVLCFPVSQFIMNIFVTCFCAQLGFYVWVMYTYLGLKTIVFGIALWDFFVSLSPWLAPTEKEYFRGLYYSCFLKENKNLSFKSLSEYGSKEKELSSKSTNVNNDVQVAFKSETKSASTTAKVYRLPRRSSEIKIIGEREEKAENRSTE